MSDIGAWVKDEVKIMRKEAQELKLKIEQRERYIASWKEEQRINEEERIKKRGW